MALEDSTELEASWMLGTSLPPLIATKPTTSTAIDAAAPTSDEAIPRRRMLCVRAAPAPAVLDIALRAS